MAESKDLLQVLWSGADVLRGKMDANEYKTYLLGLIFYKYLSDSYLAKVYDLLNDETPDDLQEAQKQYEEVMKTEDAKDLLQELRESMHYTLEPDMTYVSILMMLREIHLIERNYRQHLIVFRNQMNYLMDCLLM